MFIVECAPYEVNWTEKCPFSKFENIFFSSNFNAFVGKMLIFMGNLCIREFRPYAMFIEKGLKSTKFQVSLNLIYPVILMHCYLLFVSDKGFRQYSSRFPISVMVFEFKLMSVKLAMVQEEPLVNFLSCHHGISCIALYIFLKIQTSLNTN